ncbi:GLABROUS1 enhancer-binding protein-like [Vicia villosa]|uniref:GLABROUS1 enhancer-binding protein-like n=1 Tax=Vicia villosa TaxID=3911 RepID=UPI00273BCB06|nr:GLABROUS1 enhancer-binding protein-like [Vicia villosa]
MAPPKRLRITPLDDPPTAYSSDDDQPPSSKKPEDEVVDEEEVSEEGEETDQNEEDEEEEEGSSSEEEQVQPPSKNPPPSTPISNPKPESGSESESGAESGSESDSEQEPTPPNAKVKPLASKPMKAQPQAQSTPVPARSGTKRANENGSKPAKKKTIAAGGGGGSENEADGDGDVKMTGEDSKKMNPRVFTEEDEIAILKGLADFISKTGNDPMKDLVAFHRFVKKSIHGDATSEQLKRKVRGLKMKFKDGGSFTKEHDKRAFELSKKVWGNTEGNNGGNEGEENGKVNEKTPKSTKKEAPVRNNCSAKKEVVAKNGAGKDEGVVDKSLALSEMCKFGEAAGLSLLNKAMERGMGLLEESKADEFDERWRKVQIAEMELSVTRGQLLKDQIRIALEALKKKSIN